MNEARIRTRTRDPSQRLLFVGIALVLRNVWVWSHFTLNFPFLGQSPSFSKGNCQACWIAVTQHAAPLGTPRIIAILRAARSSLRGFKRVGQV
jgi:hypothetical protein